MSSLSNLTTDELKEGLENLAYHYDELGEATGQIFHMTHM